MLIQQIYERLPSEIQEKVSFESVQKYIFEGPFLPCELRKIFKNVKSAGHDTVVQINALRRIVVEHGPCSEEELVQLSNVTQLKKTEETARIKRWWRRK